MLIKPPSLSGADIRITSHLPVFSSPSPSLSVSLSPEIRGEVHHISLVADKYILALDRFKLPLPPLYSRYFMWGFPDHSARVALVEADRVSVRTAGCVELVEASRVCFLSLPPSLPFSLNRCCQCLRTCTRVRYCVVRWGRMVCCSLGERAQWVVHVNTWNAACIYMYTTSGGSRGVFVVFVEPFCLNNCGSLNNCGNDGLPGHWLSSVVDPGMQRNPLLARTYSHTGYLIARVL